MELFGLQSELMLEEFVNNPITIAAQARTYSKSSKKLVIRKKDYYKLYNWTAKFMPGTLFCLPKQESSNCKSWYAIKPVTESFKALPLGQW